MIIIFEILSSLLKYIFITIIYTFIFWIARLIYHDIKYMGNKRETHDKKSPYLKLVNRKDSLDFGIDESYVMDGNTTVGREKKNDIAIYDPFMSSSHSRFFLKGETYFVEDLNSKNGTFVNGNRIGLEAVALKNGDIVNVGQVGFLFVNAIE